MIPVGGCTVAQNASITLEDGDRAPARFVNGRGVEMEATADQIRMMATGDRSLNYVGTRPEENDRSFRR